MPAVTHEGGDSTLLLVTQDSGSPFFGAYCASKWAVGGLTESMRYELSTLGIDVVAVEPGFFHTNLFSQATRSSDIARVNDYGGSAAIPERLFAAFCQLFEGQPIETDPRILVNAIGALLDAAPDARPPLRTCVGMDVGVRQLNDLIASFAPNAIAVFGMAHLEAVGKGQAAGATV